MGRIAIFIDAGYLDKLLQREFDGARIDYVSLAREISNRVSSEKELLRVYYYNCLPYQSIPPTEEERARFARAQSFFESINRLPRFELRLGRLEKRSDARGRIVFEQKRIDVLMAVDLVRLAARGQVSDVVIIAGDSDFIPALEVSKAEGVLIWLLHGANPHDDLWTLSDERIQFNSELLHKCRY